MQEATAKRPSFLAILVVSIVFLIYVWDRVIVPILAVEIRAALSLPLPRIGLLGSVFTFGLVLAAIPAGLLAGRYGTKASLVLGAIIFSTATLLFGIADSFVVLVLLRIVSGIGEGFYNVALLAFLGRMTRRHRSLAVGFPATLFGIGLSSGPPVIIAVQAMTGAWRPPFVILGVIGLVGALAVWTLLGKSESAGSIERMTMTRSGIAAVLTPGTIVIYVTVAATGVIVYSYLSLLQEYLRSENNLSPAAASMVFSLHGIGAALGGVGMGVVGDFIGRGRFLTIATLIVAVVGACVFWVSPSLVACGALSMAIGLGTNGIFCNSIALVQDQAGNDNIPIATGMLAIIYYLSSAFSGYLVGHLVGAVGWATTGVLAYTLPYLVVAPFLFALVWRTPERSDTTALLLSAPAHGTESLFATGKEG
jgi:predicted MFS family arabinose efflux permease